MNKLRINLNNQNIPNTFNIENNNKENEGKNSLLNSTKKTNKSSNAKSKKTRNNTQNNKQKHSEQDSKKITDIIFILDRSGSMSGLENDTIGGFNSMIKKQKKENINDETFITTVLFDNHLKTIHNRTPLNNVKTLTEKDYFVGGSTALFDAIGFTLNNHKTEIDKQNIDTKDNNTIVIITTDGYENSSKEYNYKQIKDLITTSKDKGWEFIFLGANINSEEFGNKIGIGVNNSIKYSASSVGTSIMFDEISDCMSSIRKAKSSDCYDSINIKSMFKKSMNYNDQFDEE